MKRFIPLFVFITLVVSISSASGKKDLIPSETVPPTLKVAALVGPSGIGMAYLFSNSPNLGEVTIASFEAAGSVDILLPKLLNGDIDIGILPPNVAAKLYNMDPTSVVAGAIVGNSMLTLITRDTAIKTLNDLEGKTISVVGQGATPEYVLRTLLAKTGLKEGSVTLDFSLPATEIATALISNKISYALVPEPFATIALLNGATGDKPIKRAILLRDVWEANGLGTDFPMTLCVVRREYAEKYPSTVRKFLEAYNDSITWTIANPAEAGKMVELASLGLKAPVATKAIPQSNYVFIPATDGRASIEKLFTVFLAFSPSSIGGKLPDDGFYFK